MSVLLVCEELAPTLCEKKSPAETTTQSDGQIADSVATAQNRKSALSRWCSPVLFFHKKYATVGSHQSNEVLPSAKWLTDDRENNIEHFKNLTSALHLRSFKATYRAPLWSNTKVRRRSARMQMRIHARPSKCSRTMTSLGLGLLTARREKDTA